jgi:hypothetical protein
MEDRREEHELESAWVPSPALSRTLWIGTLATVLTGGLYVARAAIVVFDGPKHEFSVSSALAWAAMLPAIWIVTTYTALGREVGSPAIGRSVQCLFVSTLMLRLYDLALFKMFIPPVQALLWIFVICGIGGVIIWTFISGSDGSAQPPETEKKKPNETDKASGATRMGAVGALIVGIFAAFKFFGKALVKVAIFKGIINFFEGLKLSFAFWGMAFLGLLTSMYAIWFAIVKIRARQRLGGLASLLGWTEILRVILLIAFNILFLSQWIECRQQPGLPQPELDRQAAELIDRLAREYSAIKLGLDLVWTALTICLFLSLRGRRDLEAEYRADFERAMSA